MKYYNQEHQPLEEMMVFREKQYKLYMENERVLNEKKETLFKTKNIKKWKFVGNEMELIGREKALLANKKLAFPFIMTEETQSLKQ